MANFYKKRDEFAERKPAHQSSLDVVKMPSQYMDDFWYILKEFCDNPALETARREWPGEVKPRRILRQFRAFQKSMRKYPQKGYEHFHSPDESKGAIPWHLHSKQVPSRLSGMLTTEFKRVAYWANSPLNYDELFETAARSDTT